MNVGSSEQKGSARANHTGGTATIVGFPDNITATVTDSYAVGADGLDLIYMKYVEGLAYQAIHRQITYPAHNVSESGTTHTTAPYQDYSGSTTIDTYNQAVRNSTQGTNAGQFLAQGNSAYLTQQDADPHTSHTLTALQRDSPQTATTDASGVTYMFPGNTTTNPSSTHGYRRCSSSHTTRISLATYQWLTQNFEVVEGESLLRSTVYSHYLRHCKEEKKDPVSAAIFGKKFLAVFHKLKIRRLGKKGENKYYYNGIRVIPGSGLNQLLEDGNSAVRQQPSSQKLSKNNLSGSCGSWSGTQEIETQCEQNINHSATYNHSNSSPQHLHHRQNLGDVSAAIPDFPGVEFPPGLALPEGCTLEDVDLFRRFYRKHCEAFLNAAVNLEFQTVQSLWREFWRIQDNKIDDECGDEYLSKTKLYLLCKFGPVQQFVRRVDYMFYQNLVEVLIPNVLRPIPISLTQGIQNFAKGLDSWLTGAMTDCPEEMIHVKLSAVSALAQTLRRYISLSRVAQAACAVLQNSSQIYHMLDHLNTVDFSNVQEQASWVCHCDDSLVRQLQAGFKKTLYQQNSLEQWAAWMRGVVMQVLKPYEGKPNYAKSARHFLLKWSFYTSVVFRNLTLPREETLGSFHLLRLLHDEYMSFLIEHQVALETGDTHIAVLGNKYNNNPSNVSDVIQTEPYNVGVSLTVGVPVSVGQKIAPTPPVVGSNAVNNHPVATKRFKIN
jgi:regulatory factor X 1/2/3